MNRNLISLTAAGALVILACMVPPRADAQNLARRLAAVKNGTVRMSFASRDDICGFENGITSNARENAHTRGNWNWNGNRSEDVVYDNECSEGPARVVAHFENGQLTRIRSYVGGRWRPAGADVTDVGTVSVKDATDYLLGLARTQSGKAAGEAIYPLTLADSVNMAQPIYSIAKDDSRPMEVREPAIFWLSQLDDDAAVGMLDNILKSSHDERIQDKAIFGLSQHRSGKGFAILRDYAEHDAYPDAARKGDLLAWSGQKQRRRIPALTVSESSQLGAQGQDHLLSVAKQGRGEREMVDRQGREQERRHRDAEESSLLGWTEWRFHATARRSLQQHG